MAGAVEACLLFNGEGEVSNEVDFSLVDAACVFPAVYVTLLASVVSARVTDIEPATEFTVGFSVVAEITVVSVKCTLLLPLVPAGVEPEITLIKVDIPPVVAIFVLPVE